MKALKTIVPILFLWPSLHLSLAQSGPKVNFANNGGNYIIRVSGVDAYILEKVRKQPLSEDSWKSIFKVYTGENAPDISLEFPSMLGNYEVTRYEIVFTPAFQLTPGLHYNANFNLPLFYSSVNEPVPDPEMMRILKANFKVPEVSGTEETSIEAVYPSIDTLPMNQLKLYIYFSSPMKYGEAMINIHLYNQSEEEEKDSFLNIPQELWNQDQTRLTVFFDPGRIKRDLAPNLQMGAPLRPNEFYTLKIDSTWRDRNGNPLKSGFEKKFYVLQSDRKSPDVQNWKLKYPGPDTRTALRIDLNEPMDYALLNRLISVKNSKGISIDGEITITDNEKTWGFEPKSNWLPGDYEIQIDVNLEDLAGNNLRRLFDMDITKDSLKTEKYHTINFRINP